MKCSASSTGRASNKLRDISKSADHLIARCSDRHLIDQCRDDEKSLKYLDFFASLQITRKHPGGSRLPPEGEVLYRRCALMPPTTIVGVNKNGSRDATDR
jgi:hypothetical protein